MILELVHREETLILGDIELLICEEPVVVLRGDLSKCPDKGHIPILNVVISSRITYDIMWPCCVMCACGDNISFRQQ